MQQVDDQVMVETDGAYSAQQIAKWRKEVMKEREALFRRNWRNKRQSVMLRSKKDVESFEFILEWCDEFDDVVGRDKERARLDRLIDMGLDVNDPANAHL